MKNYPFKTRLHKALRSIGKSQLKHSYIVSELVYHELSIKGYELFPFVMRLPGGGTHWFLKNKEGGIIDYTKDQYNYELDYSTAIRRSFLTKKPGKRTRLLLKLMRQLAGQRAISLWQENYND